MRAGVCDPLTRNVRAQCAPIPTSPLPKSDISDFGWGEVNERASSALGHDQTLVRP